MFAAIRAGLGGRLCVYGRILRAQSMLRVKGLSQLNDSVFNAVNHANPVGNFYMHFIEGIGLKMMHENVKFIRYGINQQSSRPNPTTLDMCQARQEESASTESKNIWMRSRSTFYAQLCLAKLWSHIGYLPLPH